MLKAITFVIRKVGMLNAITFGDMKGRNVKGYNIW